MLSEGSGGGFVLHELHCGFTGSLGGGELRVSEQHGGGPVLRVVSRFGVGRSGRPVVDVR